jgi:hypothetical protein
MTDATPIVTIDPEGDIAIELSRGEDKVQLRVSSKVLSLASSVFARMFKSKFREGQSLSNANSTGLVVIPLTDEDEDAFTLLCNILHFRMSVIAQTPSLSCLLNLATICDKWDFTEAITPITEQWLRDTDLSEEASSETLHKLLLVAYVLDAPVAFSKISWEVVVRHVGPFTNLPAIIDHDLIPNGLLGKIRGSMRYLRIFSERLIMLSRTQSEEGRTRDGPS